MRVAGIMSGTSLDGIDIAIVDIRGRRVSTLAFRSNHYPKRVREALPLICNTLAHTASISRMNFLLGELYAEALIDTARRAKIPLDSIELIGMHGQTIFHEGSPIDYLDRRVASTLQIGEPAVVAERTGIRVISNFRERDIAAGGQGAPLIPFVDQLLFRDPRRKRIALNIGGIANITILPPARSRAPVIAFDTGPGNMIIDALVEHHTRGKSRFDRGGRIAGRGQIDHRLLGSLLGNPYFTLPPPKSCGREEFAGVFAIKLIARKIPMTTLIATATEFTAQSIALAIRNYAKGAGEVIASGGGVHNRQIMLRLRALLPSCAISTSADFGIDPDAKEAIAFAILAREHARGRPANLPSATGARRAAILGKSSP
jgi:anhydro-N-acetylmuramic acid kinase